MYVWISIKFLYSYYSTVRNRNVPFNCIGLKKLNITQKKSNYQFYFKRYQVLSKTSKNNFLFNRLILKFHCLKNILKLTPGKNSL